MITLIDEIDVANELGEGVIWDALTQHVWWTDIEACRLFRYHPTSQKLESWETPERVCCFSPVSISDKRQPFLIVAFESGFAYYQPELDKIEWLEKIESDNPGSRLNDGRTDRQGRFWAGSMVEDSQQANQLGKLYCLDHDLNVSSTLENLSITNSLCWSPDSSTLYHCDTPTQKINCYPYDSTNGQLGNAAVFAQTDGNCFPDGSIVDAEGYLWNAQWGGHKVARYAPDGVLDLTIDLPVSKPTCVAFGGADLDLLFVSTAHQGLSKAQRLQEPKAGNLFIFKTNYKGLVESVYRPRSSRGMSVFT